MIAPVVCCVCKKVLRYVEIAPIPGIEKPVSHGYCLECGRAAVERWEKEAAIGKALALD